MVVGAGEGPVGGSGTVIGAADDGADSVGVVWPVGDAVVVSVRVERVWVDGVCEAVVVVVGVVGVGDAVAVVVGAARVEAVDEGV